ncbi:hypothetical protein NEMIN01_0704 [Nematocida minor]|uniref:uncharacterized protein n=1 Tax=Nematocida minor TaxID=1912983 RepID=UPI00221F4B5C|nr:uncharacterized protein NEMIN01_0704 [Nematocida minor]KAI5189841.1 hypothetical protein NEMIN01_0704 [Nematocida minor]
MAFIVAGGCKGLVAWNSLSKKCKTVEIDYDISRIAFVDGLAVCMSSDLHIYDASTMLPAGRMQGHSKSITSFFFKSSLLYTTSEDGMVFAWDLKSKHPVKSVCVGSPVASGVVYRDEIYLSDYSGRIYKKDVLAGKGRGNCCLYLEKYKDELIGYNRMGRMGIVSANSPNTLEDAITVGAGYGTRCAAGEVLAAGSSQGMGFVEKVNGGLKTVGFVDTPGWVWDIQFSSATKEVFYACSSGALGKVSLCSLDGANQRERPSAIASTVEFSVDYPLKALGVQNEQRMSY